MGTNPNDEALTEARRRIERAREKGSIILDLADLKLSAVPPEIGSLTALQALFPNGNQLTAVPPEIGSLTAIQTLCLHNNQLSAVPKEIRKLESSLKRLYLHDNPKLGLSLEVLGPTWSEARDGKNVAKPSAILAAYFGARGE